MKIIGAIGLNGSGKDEVINHLKNRYGVPVLSIGDIVREIAAGERLEPTRDNLDAITRRYFRQMGRGCFVKMAVERIRQNGWPVAGISGVRSADDVGILKDLCKTDFALIHIFVSDDNVRYSRTLKRGAARDQQSFNDFQRQDQVSDDLFGIHKAIAQADYSVANDGTLEDLHSALDRLFRDESLLK